MQCHRLLSNLAPRQHHSAYNNQLYTYISTLSLPSHSLAQGNSRSKPNNSIVPALKHHQQQQHPHVAMATDTNAGRLLATICIVLALLGNSASTASDTQAPPAASGDPPGPMSVRIRVNVSGHSIRLACEVAGAPGVEDHEAQFFCPVSSGDKCFGDCNPICTMQVDSTCRVMHRELLSPNVTCVKSVQSPGAKTVWLTIDTRIARLAGGWYCKFRGRASAEVSLNQFREKPTPPAATTPAVPPPTTQVTSSATGAPGSKGLRVRGDDGDATTATTAHWTGKFGPPEVARMPEATGPMQQPPDNNNGQGYDPSLLQFARADYVIGILTLLGVSLIINMAFCIRCFLANYYIAVRRRKQEPPGCLAQCLCVSTVQVEERAPDDTYEELRVLGRSAANAGGYGGAGRLPQRASLNTMETTYMEHSGCIPRSRTLPPAGNPQYSLSYLRGVSDSMSRLLYDSVPTHESRPGSRQGSVRGLSGVGGGGSMRRSQQLLGGGVPAVPEESVPFVTEAGEDATAALPSDLEAAGATAAAMGEDGGEDASSSGSGSARLELSRRMLRKADTLLREANSLLRESAQPQPPQPSQHQQYLTMQRQQQQQHLLLQQQRRQSLNNSVTAIASTPVAAAPTTHQQQQQQQQQQ